MHCSRQQREIRAAQGRAVLGSTSIKGPACTGSVSLGQLAEAVRASEPVHASEPGAGSGHAGIQVANGRCRATGSWPPGRRIPGRVTVGLGGLPFPSQGPPSVGSDWLARNCRPARGWPAGGVPIVGTTHGDPQIWRKRKQLEPISSSPAGSG
jgi:hypothetical protein